VGNIFNFGTQKSEQLGLYFTDENGNENPVYLGSYGIGVTRLMGVIAEHFADDKGLVWPEKIAPFKIYLARVGNSPQVADNADQLYARLTEEKISVIYDDRDERPGQMFADADLMGLPYRLVVSDRTLEQKGFELKRRTSNETEILSLEQVINKLKI
jgi:prolyl-tRNA synthetase